MTNEKELFRLDASLLLKYESTHSICDVILDGGAKGREGLAAKVAEDEEVERRLSQRLYRHHRDQKQKFTPHKNNFDVIDEIQGVEEWLEAFETLG